MSDLRSSAGSSRKVVAVPPPPPPRVAPDAANGTVHQLPRPVKPAKVKKPKLPLSERLPAGVYDSRPVYKRYVLHWVYFWVYSALRLYKLPFMPKPGPSQREYARRLIDELYQLAAKRHLYASALNSKGGAAKTTLATWLAVLVGSYTERSVLAVDANENKGGTAKRLGVDRSDTVTLRDFLVNPNLFADHVACEERFGHHRGSGVSVLASDPNTNRKFSQKLYVERMTQTQRFYSTVVYDCGNGLPHAANRGSAAVSNALAFTATVNQADSLDDIKETIEAYAEYGFHQAIARGVVVLFGINKKECGAYAERYNYPAERIFFIPRDTYMTREEGHMVNLKKIRFRTRLALLEVAVALFRLAPEFEVQENVSNDTVLPVFEEDEAVMSLGDSPKDLHEFGSADPYPPPPNNMTGSAGHGERSLS